jgi:hypothetical protein
MWSLGTEPRNSSTVASCARGAARRGGWALSSALLLAVRPALAAPPSTPAPEESAAPDVAELAEQLPTQLVAINPIFIPFGTLSAEYEFRVTARASLGLSGWYEFDDVRARWLYLKALIYPWSDAPNGVSLGPTLGLLRAYREPTAVDQVPRDTTPTIGAMAQYNFLFGPADLYLLGVGIGGRTPLLHVSANSPIERLDGDVRLVAGLAF